MSGKDDEEFQVTRKQAYDDHELIKHWRKQFPDEDLGIILDIVRAYKTGRRMFLIFFFSIVGLGALGLFFFGIKVKFFGS